jgi:diguanylate cyclase (GGDEF)-like protein
MLAKQRDKILFFIKDTHVEKENYKFYSVINVTAITALIGHVCFIALFALLKVKPLIIFNFFSVAAYSVCFLLNRKGYHNAATLLGILEVCVHAFLAVSYFGWNSGFHFYIICLVPIVFISSTWSDILKIFMSLLLGIIYIDIYLYSLIKITDTNFDINLTKSLNILNITFMFIVLILLSLFFHSSFNEAEQELKESNKILDILSKTDPLTKLSNRRHMVNRINTEIENAKHLGSKFSLVMCDMDNFKIFNDIYGHECGDYVLTKISEIIKAQVREIDEVSRWGGEEFLILLPGYDMAQSKNLMEQIRESVSTHAFEYNGNSLSVSMTIGISVFGENYDIHTCINNADRAMYKGKQMGKNCVIGFTLDME